MTSIGRAVIRPPVGVGRRNRIPGWGSVLPLDGPPKRRVQKSGASPCTSQRRPGHASHPTLTWPPLYCLDGALHGMAAQDSVCGEFDQ